MKQWSAVVRSWARWLACGAKGTARVCCVHEKQVCVQIMIPSNNSHTLFISCIKLQVTRHHLEPERCCFVTDSGILNMDVIAQVKSEFLDILNLMHPGVECF